MDDEEEQQQKRPTAPPPPTPVQMSMIAYFPTEATFQFNTSNNFKEAIDLVSNQTTRLNNNNNSLTINLNDFKPASRFSLNSRRECKSTSDEPNTQIIQSNSNQKESTQTSLNSKANEINKNDWLMSNISSLNTGKFGFHVSTNLNKMSTHLFNFHNRHHHDHHNHNYQSKMSSKSNSDKTTGIYNHKRGVKRLTTTNKFFMNKLNDKKHLDANQNKKLFHAVSNNDYDTVYELLESNSYDVNCNDDKQRTCLHIASSRGNVNIVRLLLDYGANPNLRDCVNNLPIHLAIIASHVPVVTVLLEAGTDIHSLDMNGKTVIHLAGSRLRWLLSEENNKVSPKLKYEAIIIMNMIKEYLKCKKANSSDLDKLVDQLENVFNISDISNITKEILDKFDSLDLTNSSVDQ